MNIYNRIRTTGLRAFIPLALAAGVPGIAAAQSLADYLTDRMGPNGECAALAELDTRNQRQAVAFVEGFLGDYILEPAVPDPQDAQSCLRALGRTPTYVQGLYEDHCELLYRTNQRAWSLEDIELKFRNSCGGVDGVGFSITTVLNALRDADEALGQQRAAIEYAWAEADRKRLEEQQRQARIAAEKKREDERAAARAREAEAKARQAEAEARAEADRAEQDRLAWLEEQRQHDLAMAEAEARRAEAEARAWEAKLAAGDIQPPAMEADEPAQRSNAGVDAPYADAGTTRRVVEFMTGMSCDNTADLAIRGYRNAGFWMYEQFLVVDQLRMTEEGNLLCSGVAVVSAEAETDDPGPMDLLWLVTTSEDMIYTVPIEDASIADEDLDETAAVWRQLLE